MTRTLIFNKLARLGSLMALCCVAIALLCGVASCDKDHVGPLYTPGSEPEGSCGFASTVLNVEVSAEDEGIITIPIYRNGTAMMQQKVQFQYDTTATGSVADSLWCDTDPNGVFTLATKNVIFAPKALSANVMLSFSDLSKVRPGSKYIMRLKLVGQENSLQKQQITITVKRKLTFEKFADCTYKDDCMFEYAYDCELFKATDSEVYRVMKPYTEGLAAEEYTAAGLSMNPPDYMEFMVEENDRITFDPFYTGMLVPVPGGKTCGAYCYYPGEYKWGKDFSEYNKDCKRLSDKVFQIYAVYCLPDFQYGFLDQGAFKITITIKD